MKLFSRRQTPDQQDRVGTMEELERLVRRLRALPLAAPLLLLVGFGVGEVTNRGLRVPCGGAVRATTEKEAARVDREALGNRLHSMSAEGKKTFDYVRTYREHVEPVEKVLRRHGISRARARKISWPLVEQSYAKGLDPATVVAVMLVE